MFQIKFYIKDKDLFYYYWDFVSCHSVEVQSLYTYYCEEKSWKYLLCIKPKQLMKKNI